MEDEVDLHKVPLTALTYQARIVISCLLNSTKILQSDGPYRVPRDWRGLATLVNISAEIARSYESCPDKTAKVLDYWIQQRDGTATVGHLLEFVQQIDRYDIFDDFMELAVARKLFIYQPLHPQQGPRRDVSLMSPGHLVPYEDDVDEDLITFDDKIHGSPQFYHAYVLYAQEDREFVNEMINRMRLKGFKLCIEEDLLPDHSTTFAPVSRLISSERCNRIILVYSPDFLGSPANNFYMDYAQAIGIEMKRPKIIPCMYRHCTLPPQVTFYHKLFYNAPGNKSSYDFWERLSASLLVNTVTPKMNSTTSFSTINITELQSNATLSGNSKLAVLPSPPKSASVNGLDSIEDTQSSLSSGSQNSDKKLKPRRIKRILDIFNFKKNKDVKIRT